MEKIQSNRVHHFATGKESAFREIYNDYSTSLRYFAAKYIDNDTVIDDVIQDSFVSLWEKREGFVSESAVKAYLYRVVQSFCLNLIRHEKVKEKYLKHHREETESAFLENVLQTEIFQYVLTVFDELPPACKAVYQLSLEGLKHDEISEKLNISVNTVKKHKNNANHYMRKRLKQVLEIVVWCSFFK